MAWPTSPSRLPGSAAAMPASIPRRVASTSSVTSRGTGPIVQVRAQSACQPSRMQPTSMLTTSPSARRAPRRRDAVDDLVVDAGADRAGERRVRAVALERGDGARVADHALGDGVEVAGGDARAQLARGAPRGCPPGSGPRRACARSPTQRLMVTAPALRMISRPQLPRARRRAARISSVTASIGFVPSRRSTMPGALVVVDDREHRRHLLLEARAHDLGPIVVALPERGRRPCRRRPGRAAGPCPRGTACRTAGRPSGRRRGGRGPRSEPRCRARAGSARRSRRASRRARSPGRPCAGSRRGSRRRRRAGCASSSMNMAIVSSSGTSSPASMYSRAASPSGVPAASAARNRLPEARCDEAELARQDRRPGCPCRRRRRRRAAGSGDSARGRATGSSVI